MVYQPPAGARDLLPLDVAQKRWIEDRLQQVFHRWGYHRIITSTLERLDTLMAGGAVQPSTVLQLQNWDDEALGLRPELTASIARAAVTRMAGALFPQRLYYNANVFRRAHRSTPNRQQEFYQAGVELLGVGGVAADAEVLLLLAESLNNLALGPWFLVLGEAGLTQSLLSHFPDPWRDRIREAIAQLDRITLEELPIGAELREQALLLMDLRGQPGDVLQRVSSLDLSPAQRQIVNDLKSLVHLLGENMASASGEQVTGPTLILDLSLLRTFEYYTGIVFEVVSQGRVLGQGGRYDQLLGLYNPSGNSHPGIGFSLNIEDLHQILLTTEQLPHQTPASHWLVVPNGPDAYTAAFRHAQAIRASASSLVRVEIELGNHPTPEAVRGYAQNRGIGQIAWVRADGAAEIETL